MKGEDYMPGGLADDSEEHEFDPEKLKKGIKVELEHTSDPRIAKEIATDHLKEDPEYYDKLETIEDDKMENKNISDVMSERYLRVNDALMKRWKLIKGESK